MRIGLPEWPGCRTSGDVRIGLNVNRTESNSTEQK